MPKWHVHVMTNTTYEVVAPDIDTAVDLTIRGEARPIDHVISDVVATYQEKT